MPRASAKRARGKSTNAKAIVARGRSGNVAPTNRQPEVKPDVAEIEHRRQSAARQSTTSPASDESIVNLVPIARTWNITRLLDKKVIQGKKHWLACFDETVIDGRHICDRGAGDATVLVGSANAGSEEWEVKLAPTNATKPKRTDGTSVLFAEKWIPKEVLETFPGQKRLKGKLKKCSLLGGYAMGRRRMKRYLNKGGWVKMRPGEDFFRLVAASVGTREKSPGRRTNKLLAQEQTRAVLLRSAFFDPDNGSRKFPLHDADRCNAALVQGTGVQLHKDNRCASCKEENGPFIGCVVAPLGTSWFKGSCACCAYVGKSTKCSLRHQGPREAAPTAVASRAMACKNLSASMSGVDGDRSGTYQPPATPISSPMGERMMTRSSQRHTASSGHAQVQPTQIEVSSPIVITPPESKGRKRQRIDTTTASITLARTKRQRHGSIELGGSYESITSTPASHINVESESTDSKHIPIRVSVDATSLRTPQSGSAAEPMIWAQDNRSGIQRSSRRLLEDLYNSSVSPTQARRLLCDRPATSHITTSVNNATRSHRACNAASNHSPRSALGNQRRSIPADFSVIKRARHRGDALPYAAPSRPLGYGQVRSLQKTVSQRHHTTSPWRSDARHQNSAAYRTFTQQSFTPTSHRQRRQTATPHWLHHSGRNGHHSRGQSSQSPCPSSQHRSRQLETQNKSLFAVSRRVQQLPHNQVEDIRPLETEHPEDAGYESEPLPLWPTDKHPHDKI